MASLLAFAEAHRALVRAGAADRLRQDQHQRAVRALETFAAPCDLVAVTDEVLRRVGQPFPLEPVRTLHAIHLATAELLGQPPALVTILSRDLRIRDNAKVLGYALT